MLLGHHRIVELVVLVVEFDDRAGELHALLQPQPLGEAAGGDVAHHDLERDDLHRPDQLLAHVEPADEMGGHADLVEAGHDVFGDAVVQHPLALEHVLFLGVEGGRVVLEVLNQRAGLRTLVQDLRLAFVDQSASRHEKPRKIALGRVGGTRAPGPAR